MKINKIDDSKNFYTVLLEDRGDDFKGVYFTEIKGNDKKGYFPVKKYISSLIYIQKKIRAEKSNYFKVIWFDGNIEHSKYIKASNLFNDGYKDSDDFIYMINNGLLITNKCKGLLIDYLKNQSLNVPEIEGTENMGWHSSGEYVANGFSTTEDIIFTGLSAFKFSKRGDETLYKERLLKIYSENAIVFAINSYMNSAYFLKFLGNEMNQTLALNGITSKGKSTVGKLSLSLGTNPRNFYSLNSTKGNIESTLKHSNHAKCFFDEVAETNLTKEDRKNLIYSLANGSERGRLKKSLTEGTFQSNSVSDEDKNSLVYTVLIAGEESFLQGIDTNGSGIQARYLEIVLPEDMPLWESINTPEEAEDLNRFIHENYGFIDEDYIKYVKDNKETIIFEYDKKLLEVREEVEEASNVFKRKVRILAYTYVSSLILARLLTKDEDLIREMCKNSFEAFKKVLFNDIQESNFDKYKETLSHLQDTMYKYLDDLNNIEENRNIIKKLGYIKSNSTFKEFSILSNCFSEFCSLIGLDEKLFIAYLKSKKLLISDEGRNTKKMMFNKARANYYHIRIPHSFFISKEEEDLEDLEDIKNAWSNS